MASSSTGASAQVYGPPVKSRNARGNTEDRERRRRWIRREFGLLGGELLCHHCRQPLQGEAWEVDRFPVCGHRGGRYVQGNVVPACMKCNHGRCNYPGCHRVNKNKKRRTWRTER